MELSFRLPDINDDNLLKDYVREHHLNGETSVSASRGLCHMPFGEWVKQINKNTTFPQEIWGKTYTYLCFDCDKLIGLLDIRCELSENDRWIYGDIGYSVRPAERRKGYATKMLAFAVDVCREHKMKNVILGCYKDNIASARTIINNGGVLAKECDNYKKGKTSQYYIIDVY